MSSPAPSITRGVTVGITAVLVAPADPRRTSLTIANNSIQEAFVFIGPVQVGPGSFALTSAVPPLLICRCHHGTAVTMAWYASVGSSTTDLYIIEGFEPWPPKE